jgi:hypothetical protein
MSNNGMNIVRPPLEDFVVRRSVSAASLIEAATADAARANAGDRADEGRTVVARGTPTPLPLHQERTIVALSGRGGAIPGTPDRTDEPEHAGNLFDLAADVDDDE